MVYPSSLPTHTRTHCLIDLGADLVTPSNHQIRETQELSMGSGDNRQETVSLRGRLSQCVILSYFHQQALIFLWLSRRRKCPHAICKQAAVCLAFSPGRHRGFPCSCSAGRHMLSHRDSRFWRLVRLRCTIMEIIRLIAYVTRDVG